MFYGPVRPIACKPLAKPPRKTDCHSQLVGRCLWDSELLAKSYLWVCFMNLDPSQNFMASYPPPLDVVFLPKNVAVIGAKDTIGSVGRTLLLNLMSGQFQGKIYPINPKRSQVFD